MKGKISLLLLLVLVLSAFDVSAAQGCNSFCKTKDYLHGVCRATTESGFCQGDEQVYGFSQCTNYKRCCCGNSEQVLKEDSNVTSVQNETVSETAPSSVQGDFHWGSFAKSIFWYLVILVLLLGFAVFIKNKAFFSEPKKEEAKEELL
ncbi:hypothetical protein HZA98_01250 [Candidatus Woesearchaeota archaeon]|nr:hypothetical protein [Candidatus Woesearchaeota archaeon]